MSNPLVSPGVQVTIIDQSQFTSAPAGTVPFILVATAENKLNQNNSIAQYTTANTAGQLFLETSQRSLVNDYGAPIFENVQGTPVNASELNEYGLMAAYSTLGVSDAAYILRAPIDLSALSGSLIAPVGPVANGTIWFNTATTSWGIFQYSASSQSFTAILPTNASGSGKLWVLSLASQTNNDSFTPLAAIGKPGDYAVVTASVSNPVWYYSASGWKLVGSASWQSSLPAVTGANTVSGSITGNLILNSSNVSFNGANLTVIASNIEAAGIAGIGAFPTTNRLAITANSAAVNGAVVIGAGSDANVLASLGLTAVAGDTFYAPAYQASTFTNVPQWNSADTKPAPTGSVWFNTSTQAGGANLSVNVYNSVSATWAAQNVTVAPDDATVNFLLDPVGGGINIPAGTFYFETGAYAPNFEDLLLERISGSTIINGSNTTPSLLATFNYTVNINTSVPSSNAFTGNIAVSFQGPAVGNLISAINGAGITGIQAGLNNAGQVYVENVDGGTFFLYDVVGHAFGNVAIPVASNPKVSNWVAPTYVVSGTAPTSDPAAGTIWFYDDPTQADILVSTGSTWASYRTVSADARGYNLTTTDPSGPIVSATAPSTQLAGSALVAGDIWLNTSDLAALPNIYRFTGSAWAQIDNTDHTSSNGIIFADARWSAFGNVDPGLGTLTPISTLLNVNVAATFGSGVPQAALDSDAPSPVLYPRGTLLFNTRRSAMNVKQFETNYLTETAYQTASGQNPIYTDTWVTASGNDTNGVAFQGSAAQRNMVVKSLIATLENSSQLLDEFYNFNLSACPGYPELLPALVNMNIARNETAFIVSESPLTLAATPSAVNAWANNLNGATTDGVDGLVTFYDYAGVYYPAGLTTDLSGNSIVVPSSYMALPTIIQSDAVSYPWFAPAGARRGLVNNATALGYVNEATGAFVPNSISQGLRDILYPAEVNPIANFPASGIQLFGQKTRQALDAQSELGRINVARLVIYLRQAFNQIGGQYVFEQNDSISRQGLAFQLGEFLKSIQAQRGITDYVVVCDLTNNSPATIDANEMIADVAIAPTTTAEFIYIPVTLVGQGVITSSSVTAA